MDADTPMLMAPGIEGGEGQMPTGAKNPKLNAFEGTLSRQYQTIPGLRRIPFKAAAIIALLALVQVIVWAAVGIVLHFHSALTGTAVLSYTFGLRHALDADHISAIDLMTRRLVASGQRPVTVGTWFSLGHSTIVVITSLVVAATASAISKKFNGFSYVGGIVGTSVSAAFLLLLGAANAYIMFLIYRELRRLIAARRDHPGEVATALKIEGGGPFFRIFKRLFRLVDRPWKMYPVGVLFGLGFDTSSEIALLGIASIQGTRGTSLWLILIFPLLFTSGMCLIDTIDGALMFSLYSSASLGRDAIAIAYYNVVLSGLTVLVALVIGTLQLFNLVLGVVGPQKLAAEGGVAGSFWRGVSGINNNFDIVGGVICGLFVVTGVSSVLLYGPWRKWVGVPEAVPRAVVFELEPAGAPAEVADESEAQRDVQRVVSSREKEAFSVQVHGVGDQNAQKHLHTCMSFA